MNLKEILESNENVVVYVDTNKIKEVETLPNKYLNRLRITPSILREALDCKTIRESEDLLGKLTQVPIKSIESLAENAENEEKLKILSNLVFANSFFERIATDSKNQAAHMLGKDALSTKEHLLGQLYEVPFYALTGGMSYIYKFAEQTIHKHQYNGLYSKVTDKAADIFIKPVLNALHKYKNKKLKEEYKRRIGVIEETEDSFFIEHSNKKTRHWFKRKEKSPERSRKKKLIKSLKEELREDLNDFILPLRSKKSNALDNIFNYSDIDLFTTAYIDAQENGSSTVIYTGDKEFITAGKNMSDVTQSYSEKGVFNVIYNNGLGFKRTRLSVPEDFEELRNCLRSNLEKKANQDTSGNNNWEEVFQKNLPYKLKTLAIPPIIEAPLYTGLTYFSGVLSSSIIRILYDTINNGLNPEAPFADVFLNAAGIAALPMFAYYMLKSPEVVYHQAKNIKENGIKQSLNEGVKYLKYLKREIGPRIR